MFDISHDRHVDKVPADARHASFGKVLRGDVAGSIVVRIGLISAFTAAENRLGRSVPLVNKAAPITPLAGMTRINRDYLTARLFRLVGREGAKLAVAPRMMP